MTAGVIVGGRGRRGDGSLEGLDPEDGVVELREVLVDGGRVREVQGGHVHRGRNRLLTWPFATAVESVPIKIC